MTASLGAMSMIECILLRVSDESVSGSGGGCTMIRSVTSGSVWAPVPSRSHHRRRVSVDGMGEIWCNRQWGRCTFVIDGIRQLESNSVGEQEGRELTKKTERMSLWRQVSLRVLTARYQSWAEERLRGVA